MVELSKAQTYGIVTLFMILSGAVTISNIKSTYYCESEEIVRECAKISSTMKTCYWLDIDLNETRDICSGGSWMPITNYVKLPIIPDKDKIGNINITRPILMRNAHLYKDLVNIKYIEGNCISTI